MSSYPASLRTLLVALVIAVAASAHAAASGCAGDCNADQKVTVDELIQAVRIALGEDPIASCPAADSDGDGRVAIADVVRAVAAALGGCQTPVATTTASSTPSPTETPLPPFSATPTRLTATPTPNRCGDGVLEAGETCDTCAVDCQVLACVPVAPMQTFRVDFSAPGGVPVSQATVLIGYRSDQVNLAAADPASRIGDRQSGIAALVSNLGYGVRVTLNTHPGTSVSSGQLFTIDFDSCQGAPLASVSDFGCQVESCNTLFGVIDGCECSVDAAAELGGSNGASWVRSR
jgi:hypothetical protein